MNCMDCLPLQLVQILVLFLVCRVNIRWYRDSVVQYSSDSIVLIAVVFSVLVTLWFRTFLILLF